jgi:hypothetical protein
MRIMAGLALDIGGGVRAGATHQWYFCGRWSTVQRLAPVASAQPGGSAGTVHGRDSQVTPSSGMCRLED